MYGSKFQNAKSASKLLPQQVGKWYESDDMQFKYNKNQLKRPSLAQNRGVPGIMSENELNSRNLEKFNNRSIPTRIVAKPKAQKMSL